MRGAGLERLAVSCPNSGGSTARRSHLAGLVPFTTSPANGAAAAS